LGRRRGGDLDHLAATPDQVFQAFRSTHYDIGLPTERVQVSISAYSMHFLSPWLAASFTPGPFTAVMPMESAGAAQ